MQRKEEIVMIPLVEPASLYEPVAHALVWLGAIGVAGMALVVALVARSSHRRPPALVRSLPQRLRKAA
jgi:hypothetical protein